MVAKTFQKMESLAEAGVELFVWPPAPTSLRGRVWRKIVRGVDRDLVLVTAQMKEESKN